MIDRTNHHLFQPLLYQVATAGLAPSDITVPIRWILRKERNARVILGEVERIDTGAREVVVSSSRRGSLLRRADRHRGVSSFVLRSRRVGSVRARPEESRGRARDPAAVPHGIRTCGSVVGRRGRTPGASMTFVIVGGGATGVELAGTMIEIVRKALPSDFRSIDTRTTRVVLVEAGPRLLPRFRSARQFGREAISSGSASKCGPGRPSRRSTGTGFASETSSSAHANVFWAAGNLASPLGAMLGGPVDRAGRVLVRDDLSVPGHPEGLRRGRPRRRGERGRIARARRRAGGDAGRTYWRG